MQHTGERRARVTLLGDSIRMNAQSFVCMRLGDDIALSAPAVNCESSRTLRAHLKEWAPPGSADVVHVNCGLHDIRHDPGCDHPLCTADEYADNLRAIFEHLARAAVTVIWATSTPFDEATHNRVKASRRFAADLAHYNRISVDIARAAGARIHDLHAHLSRMPLDSLWLPDGLHFNRVGCDVVGAAIAAAIDQALVQVDTRAGSSQPSVQACAQVVAGSVDGPCVADGVPSGLQRLSD